MEDLWVVRRSPVGGGSGGGDGGSELDCVVGGER